MLVMALAACGNDDGSPDPYPSDPGAGANGGGTTGAGASRVGPDGLPIGADGKPLPAKLDGRYEMSSTFDLTSAGILPNVANDTLKALSNFREHPTQTMVDLLDAAKVPIVPTVLNAIPSFIRDYVLGYIDDHIIKSFYNKVPFAQSLTGMLDDVASIVTKFELVTTLDLPWGDATGNAAATHTLSGVGYSWSGKRNVIKAPDVLKNLEQQPVPSNAVALEKRSPELESARLKMAGHTFTVPLGSFTLLAVEMLAKDKLGAASLRDAIGKVVDCAAVADNVSKRCIDPPGPGKVCVDHKSEIQNLCTVGLDILVGVVQGQIKRLDLPLLRLQEGTAQMWDAPAENGRLDGTVDRIDHGYWMASVNTGTNEKRFLATFLGRRIGEASVPSR